MVTQLESSNVPAFINITLSSSLAKLRIPDPHFSQNPLFICIPWLPTLSKYFGSPLTKRFFFEMTRMVDFPEPVALCQSLHCQWCPEIILSLSKE